MVITTNIAENTAYPVVKDFIGHAADDLNFEIVITDEVTDASAWGIGWIMDNPQDEGFVEKVVFYSLDLSYRQENPIGSREHLTEIMKSAAAARM